VVRRPECLVNATAGSACRQLGHSEAKLAKTPWRCLGCGVEIDSRRLFRPWRRRAAPPRCSPFLPRAARPRRSRGWWSRGEEITVVFAWGFFSV